MIPQGHQSGGRHEQKDVDVLGLGMIAALLLVAIVVCLLVSGGVLHFFNRTRAAEESSRPPVAEGVRKFPPPALIKQPGKESRDAQAREQAELNSYRWVDRPAGMVRIPVERAMQIIVVQGLPEVGAGQTRQQLLQSRGELSDQSPIAPTPEVMP